MKVLTTTFLFRVAITIMIVAMFVTIVMTGTSEKRDLQALAENMVRLNTQVQKMHTVFDDADKFMRPIVRVEATGGVGTAVAIKVKDGFTYFLTANHVVDNESNVDLVFGTGEILLNAAVIANNTDDDLALIKAKGEYKFAKFAAREPKLYTRVVAVGCPLGLMPTPTEGILVGKRGEHIADLWYYTAPTLYGNSGGAVYTADGKLIGISVRITVLRVGFGTTPVYHLGLFVPLPTITSWLDEVLE